MSKCRSCRAPIGWLRTEGGKPMCVNPGVVRIVPYVPDTERVTIVTREGRVLRGTRVVDSGVQSMTTSGWVPHWVTCPDAGVYRK